MKLTSIPTNDSTPDYQPEFINHQTATKIFGLSRSLLYRLAFQGKIKSVSLRERGQIKGKRLFVTDSIREFLLKNIQHVQVEAGR